MCNTDLMEYKFTIAQQPICMDNELHVVRSMTDSIMAKTFPRDVCPTMRRRVAGSFRINTHHYRDGIMQPIIEEAIINTIETTPQVGELQHVY
ncbi:hypothetical protein AVEN_140253-1 [Araneus ventricosus]|uniref:Uncharacterized protein n=1 Tax=Araneus ventricosus TaxID=182803 RepID=A0A4Y2LS02_ARAVE|nr:hypothetical protein AVEN_140253-1 [Araneus ventricosus]